MFSYSKFFILSHVGQFNAVSWSTYIQVNHFAGLQVLV